MNDPIRTLVDSVRGDVESRIDADREWEAFARLESRVGDLVDESWGRGAPRSHRTSWMAVAAAVVLLTFGGVWLLARGGERVATDESVAIAPPTSARAIQTLPATSAATVPEGLIPATGVEVDPTLTPAASPLAAGWIATTLPGRDGEPRITTGGPRQLVELGARRLILGASPSGCCFTSIDAWLDDGDGTWRWAELASEFGIDPALAVLLGSGPADVATDGSTVVAVGNLHQDADTEPVGRPTAWVSTDLVTWDQIDLPGAGRLNGVVRIPSGWVAVGTVDEEQRIFHSVDGRDWHATLGTGGSTFDAEPSVVAAGRRVVVEFGDGSRVWSDSGLGWSDVEPPNDPALLQAGGRIIGIGLGHARWTRDGVEWEQLAPPPTELVAAIDPVWRASAALTMVNQVESAVIVVEQTIWLGNAEGWVATPLGDDFPTTPWGPSGVGEVSVLADGALVLLGAIPEEPLNDLVGVATVWIHEPIGSPPPAAAELARDAVVDALVARGWSDIGGDHDVPGSATFGVEDADGVGLSGSVLLGQTEPVGDFTVTGETLVTGRRLVILDDRSVFAVCGDVGITITGDTVELAAAAMTVALEHLDC